MNYYALLAGFACYWLPMRLLWDMSMNPEQYRVWNWKLRFLTIFMLMLMLAGHAFISIVNPRFS